MKAEGNSKNNNPANQQQQMNKLNKIKKKKNTTAEMNLFKALLCDMKWCISHTRDAMISNEY